MSSCCQVPVRRDEAVISCPVNGAKGTLVETQTVKALLTEAALSRMNVAPHRFCADAACEVVYFDTTGQMYTKADIRVRVWHKEPFGHRMICYCFGENEAAIRREIEREGTSRAVERVRAHVQAGRCACEVRNPRGVCCLGDITRAVRACAKDSTAAH